METYTIEQKMSNSGSIHDAASDLYDRDIRFRKGCKYAVVLAAFYGDIYRTYQTADALIRDKSFRRDYSYTIIDAKGQKYDINCDELFSLD